MRLIDELRAWSGIDVDAARDLVARAADKIERQLKDQTEATDKINRLSDELGRVNQKITQLTTEIGQTRNEIENLNTERGRLNQQIDQLQTQRRMHGTEIAKLDGELIQTTNDLIRLRTAAKDDVSAARKDLIRRLVAVAISVGFASQIGANIDWLLHGGEFDDARFAQLARLFTSMLVILLAWDWYDRDLKEKPLSRIFRFILDAFIVMIELVLLLSSSDAWLWLTTLWVLFLTYIAWDFVALIEHPTAFGFKNPEKSWWQWDPRKRGPPINVLWFFYFSLLCWFPLPGKYAGYATCLLVAFGASALWCEGATRKDDRRIFGILGRFVILGVLVGLYLVFFYYAIVHLSFIYR